MSLALLVVLLGFAFAVGLACLIAVIAAVSHLRPAGVVKLEDRFRVVDEDELRKAGL